MREGGPLDESTGGQLPVSRWQAENMGLSDWPDTEVLTGSDDWPASRRYSDELKQLVRDCLRWWKEFRPTPGEILNRVDAHLEANPHLQAHAMDARSTGLVLPGNGGFEVGSSFVAKRPGM